MPAGRPPKPTMLKLVQGNPGRRPLKLDEFRPAVSIPRPPANVRANAEGLKEWKRAGAYLAQYGMISEADRAMFTCYVDAWMTYCEAVDMIKRAEESQAAALTAKGRNPKDASGLFVMTPNNFPVQSPWLAVKNKAMENIHRFSQEFGLSPAARTRVTPSDPQMSLQFQAVSGAPAGGFHAL